MKFLLAFIVLLASVAPAQAQVFWYPNVVPRYYTAYPVYRPYRRAYRRAYRPRYYNSWQFWSDRMDRSEMTFQLQIMNDQLMWNSMNKGN